MDSNAPMWLWIVVSAAVLALAVAFRVRPGGAGGPGLAWFAAALASAAMLVLIAVRLFAMLPPVTALDLGLVALAGVLTGVLLAAELASRGKRAA